MKRAFALLTSALLAFGAHAGTTIDLTAEASLPAANDMVSATVYAEASGSNPAELARRVNQEIAQALKLIMSKPGISAKSGQQHTYPVYGQDQKIENWRMRSEIVLESKDQAGVSELLGKLQQMRLAVGNLIQQPSPATRLATEAETTREAIRAFQERAKLVAEIFGKPFRVTQLNLQQNGSQPPMPMFRVNRAVMAAESAPMPIEAGESLIKTTVSGQIELAD
jgi:predicted secreted protein